MPLNEKGQKILHSMEDTYGSEKKAKSVLYASKNAGKITGIDEALQYGDHRGRDVFFGSRDQQPPLVTTPNAGYPVGILYEDDDERDEED